MKFSTSLSFFLKLLISTIFANANTEECWVHPDPHFRTWDGTYYDYHGGCDLVLVQSKLLDLHIRTVPVPGYSFVEAAVLRIGSDTFEIDTSGGGATFLKNGVSFSPPGTIGGYSGFPGFPVNQGTLFGSATYEVLLDNGASIRFTIYSGGLSINIYGEPSQFSDSEGMCGKWGSPGLSDRNNMIATDGNAMGESWRVQTNLGDNELFQSPNQHECAPPIGFIGDGNGEEGDFRDPCFVLGEDVCPEEQCLKGCLTAEGACEHVPNENERENCIYDVKTTGDPAKWANAPFYRSFYPTPPVDDRCGRPDSCQAHHEDAICVYNCVADSTFECLPALCSESKSNGGADNCACKAPKSDPNTGISGDPHIVTWAGAKYDFHGVCDLVLLQNPDFQKGLGMNIHVRTKPMKQFSYVSSAVLRIGDDTLEVMGNIHENLYWINQETNANLEKGISGYPISYRNVNSNQYEFTVDLGGKKSIIMKTYKEFVRVNIQGATKKSFGTSLGLLGSYGSGKMIARDKSTVLEDTNMFGQEWQVLSVEDMLFHNVEGPQAPEKCDIPQESTLRRHLVESIISEAEAEIVCARASPEDFDRCVFDVMATGDKDVSGAY